MSVRRKRSAGRHHLMSRRRLLRGATAAGATIAMGLPVLDAMMDLEGAAFADGSTCPKRFVLWFWGNGTVPNEWAPSATGRSWESSALMSGLDAVKHKVSIVSGTVLPTRGVNNPHVEGACGILTGGNPVLAPEFDGSSGDWNFMTPPGPSIDQHAVALLGETSFPSIVLGITTPHGSSGPGTAVRDVSHNGPYAPNPAVLDPAELFRRLFAGGVPAPGVTEPTPDELARASVLDAVLEDSASLRSRVSTQDQQRIDQHLSAIRDIERRLRATTTGMLGESCVERGEPVPVASFRERAGVMNELVSLAFACDLTRVAVMQFSSPASHSGYPDVFPEGIQHNGAATSFHEYEHSNGFDATVRTGLKYLVDVFGDHLSALEGTTEAGGTLLDHSAVLGTSELSNGWQHRFDDYPLIVAGGAGGSLDAGQHIRMEGALSSRVPLTVLRALGSDQLTWGSEQFETGDAVEALLA